MTNMPGNMGKLSHEEVLKTHLHPETQPQPGAEYPKHVTVGEKTVVVNNEREESAAKAAASVTADAETGEAVADEQKSADQPKQKKKGWA
jgi:hypothetical protein